MSTNWDLMRQYEERMKELREEAEEEGIEINEDSINNAMQVLYNMLPTGTNPSEEPSRLLEHRETPDEEDEWHLPS